LFLFKLGLVAYLMFYFFFLCRKKMFFACLIETTLSHLLSLFCFVSILKVTVRDALNQALDEEVGFVKYLSINRIVFFFKKKKKVL
jgi:uncharacterized membrane-anchored protein